MSLDAKSVIRKELKYEFEAILNVLNVAAW